MAAVTLPPDSPPPRTSRMAILAKWLGFAALAAPALGFAVGLAGRRTCEWSLLLLLLTLPFAGTAVVLALLARLRMHFNPLLWGMEEASAAYKAGAGGLVLFLVLMVMSPMGGVPPCGERIQSNDSSAVGSLRTINTICVTYASSYPERGFPRSLEQMGPPPAGEKAGPEHAGLADAALASGQKSGFFFTYTPGPPDAKGVITRYTATARPATFEVTGYRNFFTDESGVIRATKEDRAPTAKDPPLN